jgi:hypothetical protein
LVPGVIVLVFFENVYFMPPWFADELCPRELLYSWSNTFLVPGVVVLLFFENVCLMPRRSRAMNPMENGSLQHLFGEVDGLPKQKIKVVGMSGSFIPGIWCGL